jgi:flagellar motor switch protein FliN
MGNSPSAVSPELVQRLTKGVERLLASLAGTASVTARDSEGVATPHGLPGPLTLLTCRFSRGLVGPGAIVLPGTAGLGLARLLMGEPAASVPAEPTPDDEDALRELANQGAGSLSTVLGELVGKSVGFEAPEARWLSGGGIELPAWEDGIAVGIRVTAGPVTTDGFVVVPRTVAVPAPAPPVEVVLPRLAEPTTRKNGNGMELLLDISLPVTVELGRARMMIRDILHLAPGSVLELNKLAGEPVDILINDKSIARGEVVVIDENFGVRLTSIVTPSERVASLA